MHSQTKNYFISIDFFLRTVLFLVTIILLILQHIFIFCTPLSQLDITGYFYPSFGTNSWSAMGLYITCWAIIILYFHTLLLVFMDNFQIQFYATTFVLQDLIISIFFLSWTIINIIQLSNCSHHRLILYQNQTQINSSICKQTSCSVYLAPSITSFIAMFTAIGLAAASFRKINFYKIPRYLRDYQFHKSFDTFSSNTQQPESLLFE